MPVAYVAGPYTDARGTWFVQENIRRAAEVARSLWRMGFAVICPHTNSAMMGGTDLAEQAFLDGDIAMLGRCDVLVLLDDWERSKGTLGEMDCALQRGIPIIRWYKVTELRAFAQTFSERAANNGDGDVESCRIIAREEQA